VAYYAMNVWLQNFAYRTSIEFWTFLAAAGLAFFIALLTVSYQAVKAALSNPVDALRYE
jgi:putative ABC transport system permease protein